MLRPCSQIRRPMNAATCKCHGVEGCEYYTPLYSIEEICGMLRFVADALEANCNQMLSDALNAHTSVINSSNPVIKG